MEHLYIINEFVYLRLQALIWNTNALGRRSKFLDKANEVLIDIIDNVDTNKILVINCKRVNDFGQNLIDLALTQERINKRKIIFIETELLHDSLISSIKGLNGGIYNNSSIKVISPIHSAYNFSNKEYEEIINKSKKIEEEEISKIIIESYNEYDEGYKPLPSTAILAQGEFNACSIISSPKNYIWISLFLADKVEKFILNEIKPTNMLRLLGVSLRGSIFTSSVAMLLGIDFDVVDHLGPRHKLYEIDFFENKTNKYQYLYIGDFIIGGTEVKIAKTYAQVYGNNLEHAFVIASLFKPERFSSFKLGYLKNIIDLIPKSKKLDYKLYLNE